MQLGESQVGVFEGWLSHQEKLGYKEEIWELIFWNKPMIIVQSVMLRRRSLKNTMRWRCRAERGENAQEYSSLLQHSPCFWGSSVSTFVLLKPLVPIYNQWSFQFNKKVREVDRGKFSSGWSTVPTDITVTTFSNVHVFNDAIELQWNDHTKKHTKSKF